MTDELVRLRALVASRIPCDQYLEVERLGSRAFGVRLRMEDCPYPVGMTIPSDDAHGQVWHGYVWKRGWVLAAEDAAMIRSD